LDDGQIQPLQFDQPPLDQQLGQAKQVSIGQSLAIKFRAKYNDHVLVDISLGTLPQPT